MKKLTTAIFKNHEKPIKNNVLEIGMTLCVDSSVWILIPRHDSGWSKMILKIKMAYISIFRSGLQNNSLTAICRITWASLK